MSERRMNRTDLDATVVLAMKRRQRKQGQALIEYAFLMVLLATITFAVIALAGTQLTSLYQEVSFEFTHLLDPNTYAPDGSAVTPGTTPSASCPTGETLELRGHKWMCKK
jgi:Flp pilus assembly pilin Flp